MRVKNIFLRQILDSRGDKTLELEVYTGKVRALAQVPQGKSKSSQEAVYLSLDKVEANLKEIFPSLTKRSFETIQEIDSLLIELDGTYNKSKLGGNLTLGLSLALAKALAKEKNLFLWEQIKEEFFSEIKERSKPLVYANLINGGAHSFSNLAFQEYIVVVPLDYKDSLEESIFELSRFYKLLRKTIEERFKIKNIAIGDEGGFSLNFKNNLEPLEVLSDLISSFEGFKLALDIAANSFYKEGSYFIDNSKFSSEELLDYYLKMIKDFPLIISLEDPFEEKEITSFKLLREKLKGKPLIIGDDITSTNPETIDELAKEKERAIDGVIIKANQVGTLTEACLAIKEALAHNLKYIISHRSGETEDNFMIHLAKASSPFGIKIGSPVRERSLKYNELIRLFG